LTGLLAGGALLAFGLSARLLSQGFDPVRLAATGALLGLPAFSAVIFSAPLDAVWLFRAGTMLIGFGGGLFAVGTLTAAMSMERTGHIGLALGAWGAVQASAAGLAIAFGGALLDTVGSMATQGWFGPVLNSPVTGYSAVYHLEMAMLFVALIALGPLVRPVAAPRAAEPNTVTSRLPHRFGLADLPG